MAKQKQNPNANQNNHANQGGNSNNTTPNHNNSAYKGKIDNRSRQLNKNNGGGKK